jgi:hypothetical protein
MYGCELIVASNIVVPAIGATGMMVKHVIWQSGQPFIAYRPCTRGAFAMLPQNHTLVVRADEVYGLLPGGIAAERLGGRYVGRTDRR